MARRIPKPHLKLDSYKLDHRRQYPKKTTLVYSNLTARSAAHFTSPSFDNKVVVFGVQGFVKDFLIAEWNEGFFQRPKDEVLAEYKRRTDNFLGPDAVSTEHIAALHDLGYLPVVLKALPEGSRCNIKVPFLTIYNTLPEFFWLTNYLETVISDELWKQITVATITFEYRRILGKYVELTGSDIQFSNWQIHDFSMRGMSGAGDAAKTGAAHLLSSYGTDTLPAIDYLEDLYNCNVETELVAGSVPATEHSVMCMGGLEDEVGTFRRLVTEVYPSGIVSIVSDTWDFWNVITSTAATLKDVILARKENALGQAKVVFRPDSGDPVKIIAGLRVKELKRSKIVQWSAPGLNCDGIYVVDYSDAYGLEANYDAVNIEGKTYEFRVAHSKRIVLLNEVPEHVVKGSVECLWDIFGGTVTEKGFKTLNQRVGLIYGDSITLARCEAILQRLMDKGFSAGNIVFGIGSYTYQYITRDTFGMAMKATFGVVDGEDREIFKDPATGDKIKKSAKGLLYVQQVGDDFVLYDQQDWATEATGALRPVFADGQLLVDEQISVIRNRLQAIK